MKLSYLIPTLALLFTSCASTSSMVENEDEYIPINNSASYRIIEQHPERIKLSLLYRTYQFISDLEDLTFPAKATFKNTATDICLREGKKLSSLDETSYLTSTGRNALTGQTYIRLDNWISCSE